MEFLRIDLVYDMGCQFHLILSTEFKFTAHIEIYTQLMTLRVNLNFTLMIQREEKVYAPLPFLGVKWLF